MTTPTSDTPTAIAQPRVSPPRAWPYVVVLVLAGMLLSVWPHVVNLVRSGDASYIADGDGLLYIAWSRDALHHGVWSMTDAVHRPSGPMMHAWPLFVPQALVGHWLGGSVTMLGIVWRALGGGLLAAVLYRFVRPHVRKPNHAFALALFLLFDAGFLVGRLVQYDVESIIDLCRTAPTVFEDVPRLVPQFRAPTPLWALPFLIIHFACVFRARSTGGWRDITLAGISLGLLFHVYFYFATTAFPAIALAILLDRSHRATYARILFIGLIVAAPAVFASMQIKGATPADWLHRTHKFIAAPHRLILPKVLFAEWLVTAYWVFRSRRELIYLWICTGVGMCLRTHELITGIEIENFHWVFAFGVSFSLMLALLLVKLVRETPRWRIAVIAVLSFQTLCAFTLRTLETTSTRETNQYQRLADDWRAEDVSLAPATVVAGPPNLIFLLAATTEIDPLSGRLVEFSSIATDTELDTRLVLNALLTGRPREETLALGEDVTSETIARREALWTQISADLPTYAANHRVSQVIRANSDVNASPALGSYFQSVHRGKKWTIFTR